MSATLMIHLERADTETGVVWWADSPDLPGFAAAADTLAELRELTADMDVVERLADGDFVTVTVTP
jgi:predicted RNase H-like HicB family nuclease